MGTYLYLAKIDTQVRDIKERDIQKLVCFSDDELWGRKLGDFQTLWTIPKKYKEIILPLPNSGHYKDVHTLNYTLSEKIRKNNKIKLKENQTIVVEQLEYAYYIETFRDFKISSHSKRNIDYDKLPVIMTVENIKSIIDDINEETFDDEESISYYKNRFNEIIKEIESGIVWFKV